jgi:DUF971 family protein
MPNYQPPSSQPRHVAVSRSKGIRIEWADGHHSEYQLAYLRERCPCATCTGVHGSAGPAASPFQLYKPLLKIVHVEAAGGYAMQIRWNDGHATGLYSYDYLREICPCAECAASRASGS